MAPSNAWVSAVGMTTAALAGVLVGALIARSKSPRMRNWCCWMCGKRKRALPKRLILVRHGQSEGNIDPLLYCHVPDNAMHLTELGFEQAIAAGKSIKQILGDESVRFIVSPYVRTIETFQGILKAWGSQARRIPWSEEPRIREQDFGNFQEPLKIRECKRQRKRFGSFFYRFPSGESPADVYDRISSFLESLYRMFDKSNESNYVLVTHGVAIRVILTRYFKYRVCEFEQLDNFHNGEFVVLELDERTHRYNLTRVLHNRVDIHGNEELGSRVVHVETEEAKALRVHPPCGEITPLMCPPIPPTPTDHFRCMGERGTPISPTCSSTSSTPSIGTADDPTECHLKNGFMGASMDLPETPLVQ